MIVCHLTSVHPYKDTRIFIKECQSLVKAGYEVHLVAPDAPDRVLNGVHLHGIKMNSGNRLKRMTKDVYSVYKKAKEIDADIYHFHDPELIPVGLKLKKKGKIVIYDIHEDYSSLILSKFWIPVFLRKIIAFTFKHFEKYASKKFDSLLVATDKIKDKFSTINKHTVVVKNYPIINEFLNIETGKEKDIANICYIGEISSSRGIFEILKAIGRTNTRLLLGGRFSNIDEYKKASAMKEWELILELGYLNREQIKMVLEQSIGGLVVLHPTESYIASLPVKMFEYMSAGLPVIASNFPLWKEIIEGNQCGICVDPYNVDSIAEAINWIIDHSAEAKRMGENGRKAVIERYNWGNEEIKLIQLYRELLEPKG